MYVPLVFSVLFLLFLFFKLPSCYVVVMISLINFPGVVHLLPLILSYTVCVQGKVKKQERIRVEMDFG